MASRQIYHGVICQDEALVLPPGYLLVERSLNGQPVHGVRFMDVRGQIDNHWQDMAEMFLPSDAKTIKPNAAPAFLCKLLGVVQSAGEGVALSSSLQFVVGSVKKGTAAIADAPVAKKKGTPTVVKTEAKAKGRS